MAVGDATTRGPARDLADRELVFTRVFDAPRELVFELWTDAKHIPQWWGPKGFRTTIHQMDVRPGGIWRFTMHGPDGVDYENRVVYVEIVKPERLVYLHSPENGSAEVTHEVTATFGEDDGKTRLTMQMVFASAEELKRVAKSYGAVEGARQTLERLAQHVADVVSGQKGTVT